MRRTHVRPDEVVERSGRMGVAGRTLLARVAAVRVRSVIHQPFESRRVQGLTSGKDDRKIPVPESVHVRTVGYQKLHHRDAIAIERSSHQRPVAALVHVRSVFDHPRGHGESHLTRWLPRNPAFRNPRERPVLAISKRCAMQLRVARHEASDALEIVGVDGLLEFPDLLQ